MQRYLSFLQWLPSYKKNDLLRDVVAGFTVGIVLIPQGMAYAMIAGLPPVYGLYASLLPLVLYTFMGTSRQLAIGPVAMDSLLVAAGIGALALTNVTTYITMVIFLSFLVGVIQVMLGVFRMGFLVNFLSKPVISGFTSGAALIILFSQLKHFLGVEIANSNQFHTLVYNVSQKLLETNLYDVIIGMLGTLIILGFKWWNRKIPAIVFVVVLGILAVYLLDLEQYGVEVVGIIPQGLPNFKFPELRMQYLLEIWPIALTLALVGYLEAISIGKAIEEKNGKATIRPNMEFVALGASNIVGSFFQSFPVTASFSRSAINRETGAKTPLSLIFSALLVLITLLFLTQFFYYLPNAVLAAIIIVSVFGLIEVRYPKSLWNHRKDEFLLWLFTFLITLFVGIKEGILIGVLFSLLLMVYRTSKPHIAVLGQIKNSHYYKNINRFSEEVILRDDLLIIRFDAQIYFGNVNFFKKQLFTNIEKKGSDLRAIILNAEAINYIDSTAAKMLENVIMELQDRHLKFYIAGAIGPARDIIFRSEIIRIMPKEHLFVQTADAVAYFDDPSATSALQDKVAHQNES